MSLLFWNYEFRNFLPAAIVNSGSSISWNFALVFRVAAEFARSYDGAVTHVNVSENGDGVSADAPVFLPGITQVVDGAGRGTAAFAISSGLMSAVSDGALTTVAANNTVRWSFDGSTHVFTPIADDGTAHPEFNFSPAIVENFNNSLALKLTLHRPFSNWPLLYYATILQAVQDASALAPARPVVFAEIGIGFGYLMADLIQAFSGGGISAGFSYVGVDPYDAAFADNFSTAEVVDVVYPGATPDAEISVEALTDVWQTLNSANSQYALSAHLYRASTATEWLAEAIASDVTISSSTRNIVFIDGAHDEATVARDIAFACQHFLLSAGDFILLDDVGSETFPTKWDGVPAAVSAFIAADHSPITYAYDELIGDNGYALGRITRTSS